MTNSVVVTSGPITADAATAKVVGIKKSITVSASATNKVTGLSKAEKKIVKVTKKGKKFTIKGLKAGKATFKIGKKSYTVKVGATTVKAAKTKLTLTKGKKATLKFTTKSGNGDTLTFKASNKNVTLAKKSAKIAKSAASVKATAKKAGKTTITATSKATGKKATVTVTVKAATTPATATPGTSNTPSVTTGAATNTPEATATATATATASGSATNTPDVTATPVATATATPVATGSATNTPEATEVPTEAPTKAPEVVTGGTITVTTNVTGASIKVVSNGSVVAEVTNTATSTAIKGIKAGTYTVEVSKDGYVTATKEVTVSGVDVTVNLDLEVKTLQVASVVADNGTTKVTLPATEISADSVLYVTFDGEIKSTSIITGNITLTKNGVKQLIDVTYNSTKKAAVIKLKTDVFEAGATYVLNVNSVESASGLSMKAYTTTFTVSTSPIVESAKYYDYVSASETLDDLDGAIVNGKSAYNNGAAGHDSNYSSGVDTEVIELTFNKEMGTASSNDDANYKLYDVTAGKYIDKQVREVYKTTAGKTVVVIETSALTAKHEYTLTVEKVAAIDGTVMTASTVKFFYGFARVDIKAGTASANGETVLDGNTFRNAVYGYLAAYSGHSAFTFQAQMTEDVDAATVNTDTVVLKNKVTGEAVVTTVTYEKGSRYIIVTPAEDLAEETTYEITFDGIKTANGLKAKQRDFTFTTGDFAAPTVVSVTPGNGEDNVAVNKNIVVTFSEGMDASSLTTANIELLDLSNKNDTTNYLTTYYTTSLSQDKKVLTLTSIKDLEVGRTYQLTIKGNGSAGVKDDAAVANYLASDYVVKFATVDATTTYLSKVQVGATYASTNATIENGANNVNASHCLSFTFDKKITNSTVAVAQKTDSTWTTKDLDTDYTVSKTDNSNKTITVAPSGSWDSDKTYKITLSELKDENGNDVADQTFTFTVGTAPSYVTSNPGEFGTSVAVNEGYIFAVIEDANNNLDVSTLSANNVKVVKKDDQSTAPYTWKSAQYARNAVATTVVAADSPITVNGANTFTKASASSYAVGDILAFDSTDCAIVTGITGDRVTLDANVTCSDAQVSKITGAVDAGKASQISTTTLTCNSAEELAKYEEGKLYKFEDGDAAHTTYAVAVTKNPASKTVTFSNSLANLGTYFIASEAQGVVYKLNDDAKMAANTQYQIVISGVKDVAGNEMKATSKTFTTGADVQKLKFVSSNIKDGDAGVAVDSNIELTFNEKLDNISPTVITVTDNGANGSGSTDATGQFDISQDKGVVTIKPLGLLKAGNIYTVKVDHSAKANGDTTSTPLGADASGDITIRFQTEATASVKPKLVSAKAIDLDSDGMVEAGDKIILTFDKELSAAPTKSNIELSAGYTLGDNTYSEAGDITLEADKKTVVITVKAKVSADEPSILAGITTIKVKNVTTVSGVTVDDAAVVIAK